VKLIPRGYVKFRRDAVGGALREKIKEVLTISPMNTSSFSSEQVTLFLWAEEGDYIGIARGFFNSFVRGKYVDQFDFGFSLGGNELQKAKPISLRPGQGDVIDRAYLELKKQAFGGAIVEAQTGAGKTVLGLELMRRLGFKTLVIVHTTLLFQQWIEEVKKFFPHYRVGLLQGDKVQVKDKDVVIGMLQSASMHEYPEWVYQEFGTVLVDEVHKTGAPEFSKMLTKFTPKYYVGLSGTIARNDRAENVFIHGMGAVVSGMGDIEVLAPQVYFVDTGFVWIYRDQYGNFIEEPDELDKVKGQFLKKIVESENRNEIIIRQTLKAVKAGRNILILSERVAHLEYLGMRLQKEGVDVGVMVGKTSQTERTRVQKCQVICATNQLIGTGFNEPRLDTLIFASPIQDVVQPAGRIRRTHPDKKTPLILDLVDSGSYIGQIFGMARRKRYRSKGWAIFGEQVFQKRNTA
jgi:superfamily II DNA or RNA helicase